MSEDRLPRDPREIDDNQDEAAGGDLSRRTLFRLGALAGAGASVAGAGMFGAAGARAQSGPGEAATAAEVAAAVASAPSELNEATIAELQQMMTTGHLTSTELTNYYIQRIEALDRRGPKVNSVLQLNPDAVNIARALDKERRARGPRGPLHGIPIVMKANIDTADQMQTTAGSFALAGPAAPLDGTVAAKLRAAGAVILGKTNLSEWANFRSTHSSSGWSGMGGQTNSPYYLDRNPCGSSAGTGAAVSANFAAAGLGTETDGSIVCPASMNGVVGFKVTLGLTSRAGVVPISHNQDVVGPHGRTVSDVAAVLGALTGVDPRDPATAASAGHSFTDYTQFLNPNALRGARIGVARTNYFGYSDKADAVGEAAIQILQAAGAVIVDPADLPSAAQLPTDPSETTVLFYDFPIDMAAYLAGRTGLSVHTLADLIAFNNAHAGIELQYFGQEIFEFCVDSGITADQAAAALTMSHLLSRDQGIDGALQQFNLDAIMCPTTNPSFTTDLVNGDHVLGASSQPAAMAGYPHITVPGGTSFGLPVGISFFSTAWDEPKLFGIAFAFEQAAKGRLAPKFLPTLPPSERVSTRATSSATSRTQLGAGSSVLRKLGYI